MYQNNKIVIFDWGGVVEMHDKDEYNCFSHKIDVINKLSEIKMDENEIIKKWSECNYDENGKSIVEVSDQEEILKWFEIIKNKFNLNCTFEKFEQVYDECGNKVFYYKNVVEFAHSLKDKCKIGIFSNLRKVDYYRINMNYNLSKFDYVWLSYKLNCKKPNSRIYEIVENECQISPENIFFIDDKAENIEEAKKRGWKTCQATGKEINKMKERVNEFLMSN